MLSILLLIFAAGVVTVINGTQSWKKNDLQVQNGGH